jgi:hypothetical protein
MTRNRENTRKKEYILGTANTSVVMLDRWPEIQRGLREG